MNKLFTYGHHVSLPEMLSGREERVRRQTRIIKKAHDTAQNTDALAVIKHCTLISFTLNIAGPVKVNALTITAFESGITAIEKAFGAELIYYRETFRDRYGFEGYFVVNLETGAAKRIAVSIETMHPLGRLFDIDVLNEDGIKASRTGVRSCLICGAPVSECASIRRHSVSELQEKTWQMIADYLPGRLRDFRKSILIGMAYSAMIAEVKTTPKPGLVDGSNNGSHSDMDFDMFESSALAIAPYFSECFEKALDMAPDKVLEVIRPLGIEAEKTMMTATGGVNTHKGLIFSLGILCAADAIAYKDEDIFKKAAHIAEPAANELTAGGGRGTGARGQAAAGFPAVRDIALPAYERAVAAGFAVNDAGVYTLLRLIENTEDTNMQKRGGWELAMELGDDAGKLADEAAEIMLKAERGDLKADETGGLIADWIEKVRGMDELFIRHNVSPGGCADLLAITYFLEMKYELESMRND